MAANPITWPDMAAFFGLKEIRPHAWELDLIRLLDSVALKASHEKKPVEQKSDKTTFKPAPGKAHLRRKKRP